MHRGLPRIECPVCGKLVIERDITGTFAKHGPKKAPCPASGMRVANWRKAEEHAVEHGG